MQRKKKSFVEGAFVLLVAGISVKLIGALFRIPLTNLIGEEGMGLFNAAYRLYSAMLVVATVGLPVALSKMVAEAATLGKEREIKRIVKVAAGIFVPIGLIGTVLLLLFAEPLTARIGNSEIAYGVMAIAPSVFLVAVISVYRGYYQGLSNMMPTAISQVIEALFKLFVGLGLASYAMAQEKSLPMVAAYAILGVTMGEVCSAGFLMIYGMIDKRRAKPPMLSDQVRSSGMIGKNLLQLSIPIMISSSVMSLTDLIDLALVMNRLQDIGYGIYTATEIYGAYTSMPITLFNLPQTLITALSVSVIPVVAGAYASQNFGRITKTVGSALRLSMLITIPAGIGFIVVGEPILRLLFKSDTNIVLASELLAILGLAVPWVALVAITNAILQAIGRTDLPLISMFTGAMVKLVGDYLLIGNESIGIHGAPISTAVCYALISVINLVQIHRLTEALPPLGKTVLKPLAAAAGMGAAAYSIYLLLAGRLGNNIAVLLAIGCAMIVYLILILALRALTKEDVLMMPKGEKLVKILRL